MSQPKWKLIAQLGDVSPIDHGGYFIYDDETGVYPPEGELLEVPDSEDCPFYIYRFPLEKCTYINGILSDNKYHPHQPAWFAKPAAERKDRPQDTTYLQNVADCCGTAEAALITALCGDDIVARANAYRDIGSYHGFDNLDAYPLTITDKAELEARYKIKALP